MKAITDISGVTGAVAAKTAAPVARGSEAAAEFKPSSDAAANGGQRIVNNPLAGIIVTQYLNNQEDVVVQTPPSVVVAYLQNGLTPDGFSKQSSVV